MSEEYGVSTAQSIVEAIRVTDAALKKAVEEWRSDLLRQRQELVDALCRLGESEACGKMPPPAQMVVGQDGTP